MGPSATLPATIEDDSFGSRKARSSFGKGFFKIRGGKKTNSTPNLGKSKPHDVAAGSGQVRKVTVSVIEAILTLRYLCN